MKIQKVMYSRILTDWADVAYLKESVRNELQNAQTSISFIGLLRVRPDPVWLYQIVSNILRRVYRDEKSVLAGVLEMSSDPLVWRVANIAKQSKSASFKLRLGGDGQYRLVAAEIDHKMFMDALLPGLSQVFVAGGRLGISDLERYAKANAKGLFNEGMMSFLCQCAVAKSIDYGVVLDYEPNIFAVASGGAHDEEILGEITTSLEKLGYKARIESTRF